jgi:prepilin-type N-terminal cleavage/methylation domain-containing protein
MKRVHKTWKAGFTLVEILTTIAVIGILLAFLVPALTQVQKAAEKAKQKAQFSAIEIALEAVYTDTGDYPPSAWDTAQYGNYAAPQRLAEAIIGQDGFGLHKNTVWHANKTSDGNVMAVDKSNALYAPDGTVDKAERHGPYLELESANAVLLSTLYGSAAVTASGLVDSYVLVDTYKITKNTATGKMIGSPILYYRANTSWTSHEYGIIDTGSPVLNKIYSVYDAIGSPASSGFTKLLAPLSTDATAHPISTNPGWFYERTANPNFTTPARPYRSDSFILHSAGPDGLYGNADDVFNFDE